MTLEEMAWIYPNGIENVEKLHRKGATYMELKGVVDLELMMKQSNVYSLRVFDQDDDKIGNMITFVPKWPRRLIPILRSGCFYGRDFLSSHSFRLTDRDTRFAWLLTNMVHMVPSLWKHVDENVLSNRSWEGWLLTFLTTKVLPQKPMRANRNNPFHVKKCTTKGIVELLSKHLDDKDQVSFESFENVFQENDGVMVRTTYPTRKELKEFEGELVLIVFDVDATTSVILKD
jgi:hypothetical protein